MINQKVRLYCVQCDKKKLCRVLDDPARFHAGYVFVKIECESCGIRGKITTEQLEEKEEHWNQIQSI